MILISNSPFRHCSPPSHLLPLDFIHSFAFSNFYSFLVNQLIHPSLLNLGPPAAKQLHFSGLARAPRTLGLKNTPPVVQLVFGKPFSTVSPFYSSSLRDPLPFQRLTSYHAARLLDMIRRSISPAASIAACGQPSQT